jgi:hypothetical protein
VEYTEEKLGSLIAWSGDHSVYRYGTDHVVKFSRLEYILGDRVKGRIERDVDVCRRFFGQYILDTDVVSFAGRTLLIQPYITGNPIRRSHMADPNAQRQFREIVFQYHAMKREGIPPIDLIGGTGLLHSELSNVFLLNDGRVRIIDMTLIDTEGLGSLAIAVSGPITAYAIRKQERLINNLLSY